MKKSQISKNNESSLGGDVSPVNWYVAHILLRFEFYDEVKENLNRRCRIWLNEILINAKNPSEAYKKATKFGKLEEESGEMWTEQTDRKGRWLFEGLTSLVPIYEELKDGTEIFWTEYENKSVKTAKSWVKPKDKLEVFQKD